MVRIIVIGDPHLRSDQMIMSRKLVNSLISKVSEIVPDAIVVLGDTLHTHDVVRIPASTLAYKLFLELSKISQLIILVGNHDIMNNQVYLPDMEEPEHPFVSYKQWNNVIVCDKATVFEIGGIKFCGVPYVPNGSYTKAIENVEVLEMGSFFSHQEFIGVKANLKDEEGSTKGDTWPENYPLNVCGHFHEAQILSKNLIYLGTPQQQNSGESENKAIGLFTFKKEKTKDFQKCGCIYYLYERLELKDIIKRREYDISASDVEILRDICAFVESNEIYMVKVVISGQPIEISTIKKNRYYQQLDENKRVCIICHAGKVINETFNNKTVKRKTFQDFLNEKLDEDDEVKEYFHSNFT